MEAVAATGPGCEAGKCSGPGGPGTGPDSGDFSESLSPAAVWSDLPELGPKDFNLEARFF